MFVGKKVKIRWKQFFSEQKTQVFIGQILEMDDTWVKVKGKSYLLTGFDTQPRVSNVEREVGIPVEAIAVMTILPDDLDLNKLEYKAVKGRIAIKLGPEEELGLI